MFPFEVEMPKPSLEFSIAEAATYGVDHGGIPTSRLDAVNAPTFYELANLHFNKLFGLSLEEAGLEAIILRDFHDLSPADAALEAGYAYDLDRVDLGWR